MNRIIGGLLAVAMLTGCSAIEEAASGPSVETYTCADLAKEAADIGENALGVSLLKVRAPEITKDHRTDYTVPTGAEDVVVLQCKGTGVFSSGETGNVKLEMTVDADEDMFVSWEPIR